jgi:hypothetical protein
MQTSLITSFIKFLLLGLIITILLLLIKYPLEKDALMARNTTERVLTFKKLENRVSSTPQDSSVFSFNINPGNVFTPSPANTVPPQNTLPQEPELINTQKPSSYELQLATSPYSQSVDMGKNTDNVIFSYGGSSGDELIFYNGNNFDLNNVKISLHWNFQGQEMVSEYFTSKIKANLYFRISRLNTAGASIPFDTNQKIKSLKATFEDNAGEKISI